MPIAPRRTDTEEGFLEVATRGFPGTPEAGRAVLNQEAAGQSSFVNSDTLPSDMSDARVALEQSGVVFGDPVPGDPMFIYVTLPDGWVKTTSPGNDSRWTELHDEKGRKRAMMFYKAAFYDRSAHLSITRRFDMRQDYDCGNNVVYYVTDGGKVIFTTAEYPFTEKFSDEYYAQGDKASTEARAWLTEHYPDWEDAAAYWD
jgi:hypothetical protein